MSNSNEVKFTPVEQILYDELKEIRRDLKELRKRTNRVEIRAAAFASIFVLFGGFLKSYFIK